MLEQNERNILTEYSLQQLVSITDFSDRDAAWLDSEAEGAELV